MQKTVNPSNAAPPALPDLSGLSFLPVGTEGGKRRKKKRETLILRWNESHAWRAPNRKPGVLVYKDHCWQDSKVDATDTKDTKYALCKDIQGLCKEHDDDMDLDLSRRSLCMDIAHNIFLSEDEAKEWCRAWIDSDILDNPPIIASNDLGELELKLGADNSALVRKYRDQPCRIVYKQNGAFAYPTWVTSEGIDLTDEDHFDDNEYGPTASESYVTLLDWLSWEWNQITDTFHKTVVVMRIVQTYLPSPQWKAVYTAYYEYFIAYHEDPPDSASRQVFKTAFGKNGSVGDAVIKKFKTMMKYAENAQEALEHSRGYQWQRNWLPEAMVSERKKLLSSDGVVYHEFIGRQGERILHDWVTSAVKRLPDDAWKSDDMESMLDLVHLAGSLALEVPLYEGPWKTKFVLGQEALHEPGGVAQSQAFGDVVDLLQTAQEAVRERGERPPLRKRKSSDDLQTVTKRTTTVGHLLLQDASTVEHKLCLKALEWLVGSGSRG